MPKATKTVISTARLIDKIVDFCELYSNREFYPYQRRLSRRIIRSVLENDGEEITALFSRQSGKSECVSITSGGLMIILPTLANLPMFSEDSRFKMFKDGISIGIFAPSERQAKLTYNKIKGFIQSETAYAVMSDPEFNLDFTTSNGQTVALSNGSFVTAISASDGSNIEGESFKLIICDEAQDISNFKITKSIRPMGAAYNATTIDIGTATTYKGYFYDVIQRNKADDIKKTSILRNHYEYNYTVASKYNAKYAKFVEGEKKRLGENSDAFRMSYKLEWIIERGMFIDIALFLKQNTEALLERTMYDKTNTHVIGIDVGGKGDSTVCTVVEVDWGMPVTSESRINELGQEESYETYNTYLKDWLELKEIPDYEEQYALIVEYIHRFKVARVVIDATRESALADRLRANLECEVISFVFTQKAKSEMYKTLDREITAGRARICAGEATQQTVEYNNFLNQLADLQKGYSGANMVVSHPTERGAHDDYPDSWGLAVWGAQGKTEVVEVRSSTNVFTATTRYEKRLNTMRNRVTARRR